MLLMLSVGCAGLGTRGERSAVKKQRQIRSVHSRSGALVIRLPVRLPRNVQNFGHTSCDNMDTGGSITLVGCRRLVNCGEANVDCAEVLLAVLARVFVSGCKEVWRGVLVRVLKVVLRGFVQERTTAGIERSVTSVRTNKASERWCCGINCSGAGAGCRIRGNRAQRRKQTRMGDGSSSGVRMGWWWTWMWKSCCWNSGQKQNEWYARAGDQVAKCLLARPNLRSTLALAAGRRNL